MARIRTIKPEISQSESLSALPADVVLTFVFLWPYCDDRGRYWANPTLVRAAVAPLRSVTDIEVAHHIALLVDDDKLCTYRGCDGKVYLHVVGWDEHQKIDKPSHPIYPPCRYHEPDGGCSKRVAHKCLSEPASVLAARPVSTADLSRGAREGSARTKTETPGDAPVLPLSRGARETVATDLDLGPRTTDLVPGTKNMTVPRSAAPDDAATATRRGARIPDPFTVDAAMRGWAHERGWSDADIAEATDEFVDYWRGVPGARGTKLDWPATWKNRLRDQERRFRVQRSPGPDKVEHGLRLAERLASEGR